MAIDDAKFRAAVERFDAANSEDPNREIHEGEEYPGELLYARRMTRWLERVAPDASEPLRLAARCQHIRRWTIPRSDYPEGREGYHAWRTHLARFHAREAGAILRDVGYDEETVARVESLLLKKDLGKDPDTQTLEDVICLVFLENYLEDFAKQHEERKLVTILRKTWKKMSPRGREIALGLDLAPEIRVLVEKAVAPYV